jgi:hypothetical protein
MISLESYLSMKNDEQRILLSKLRISNHNLEIERGNDTTWVMQHDCVLPKCFDRLNLVDLAKSNNLP